MSNKNSEKAQSKEKTENNQGVWDLLKAGIEGRRGAVAGAVADDEENDVGSDGTDNDDFGQDRPSQSKVEPKQSAKKGENEPVKKPAADLFGALRNAHVKVGVEPLVEQVQQFSADQIPKPGKLKSGEAQKAINEMFEKRKQAATAKDAPAGHPPDVPPAGVMSSDQAPGVVPEAPPLDGIPAAPPIVGAVPNAPPLEPNIPVAPPLDVAPLVPEPEGFAAEPEEFSPEPQDQQPELQRKESVYEAEPKEEFAAEPEEFAPEPQAPQPELQRKESVYEAEPGQQQQAAGQAAAPASDATLVCFDFDFTMVKGHFHKSLTKAGVKPILKPPGLVVNGRPEGVHRSDGYSIETVKKKAEELLGNKDKGLKNPKELASTIRTLLNQGHKIAITTFTLYPDVVPVALEKLGLTAEERDKIVIIGGFPHGAKDKIGKQQHIARALKEHGIEGIPNDHIMLIDDDKNNITIATSKEIGMKGIQVDEAPGAGPEYLAKAVEKGREMAEKARPGQGLAQQAAAAAPQVHPQPPQPAPLVEPRQQPQAAVQAAAPEPKASLPLVAAAELQPLAPLQPAAVQPAALAVPQLQQPPAASHSAPQSQLPRPQSQQPAISGDHVELGKIAKDLQVMVNDKVKQEMGPKYFEEFKKQVETLNNNTQNRGAFTKGLQDLEKWCGAKKEETQKSVFHKVGAIISNFVQKLISKGTKTQEYGLKVDQARHNLHKKTETQKRLGAIKAVATPNNKPQGPGRGI